MQHTFKITCSHLKTSCTYHFSHLELVGGTVLVQSYLVCETIPNMDTLLRGTWSWQLTFMFSMMPKWNFYDITTIQKLNDTKFHAIPLYSFNTMRFFYDKYVQRAQNLKVVSPHNSRPVYRGRILLNNYLDS